MRSGVGVGCFGFVSALTLARVTFAQTETCGSRERPWVEIATSSSDATDFERLLQADLAPRQIDVCHDAASHDSTAVATVTVTVGSDRTSITAEVRDGSNSKEVSRDLDLKGIPEDGRSYTLAAVVSELLRAAWAELALIPAPAPVAAIPVVSAAPKDVALGGESRTRSTASPIGIEAVAVGEHWAGSANLYGADLRVVIGNTSRFGAGLRVGARGAPTVSAADGQVRTTALLGGVSVSFRATPAGDRQGVDAIARLDVSRIAFQSAPNPGARGADRAETAVLIGAGMDGWIAPLDAARFFAEALVEAPIQAVGANDSGHSVVAVSGAGVEVALGIRVAF